MDISPGPPFWRLIPDDMDIPLLDHLGLSGRPDTYFHGTAVNFALKLSERGFEQGSEGGFG